MTILSFEPCLRLKTSLAKASLVVPILVPIFPRPTHYTRGHSTATWLGIAGSAYQLRGKCFDTALQRSSINQDLELDAVCWITYLAPLMSSIPVNTATK